MKTFLISVDEKAKRWGTKLDLTEAHEPPNVYGLLSLMRYFVFHNFDVRVFFSFFGSSRIFLEIQNHKTDWRRFEKERVWNDKFSFCFWLHIVDFQVVTFIPHKYTLPFATNFPHAIEALLESELAQICETNHYDDTLCIETAVRTNGTILSRDLFRCAFISPFILSDIRTSNIRLFSIIRLLFFYSYCFSFCLFVCLKRREGGRGTTEASAERNEHCRIWLQPS